MSVPAQAARRAESLLVELRRRNVLKVTASYLVGMWIVLQVAQVTFAPLRFPEWWMTALTILAVTGLPIVMVLAWAYEITPAGVVLDAGPAGAGVRRHLPRARQSIAPVIVTGVALMALVTGFAWWRTLDVPVDATATTAPPLEPGARSIAVLPLVDMSPAGGNTYLGDGLSEELSTKLAQVPGLRVAARTSAFEFKGRNLDVRKIGQSLGVRHVLEGSVRRNGDNVRVTVQLIDTVTGYHAWAGNFDRPWRDVLALQDDIAISITDALQIVLREKASGPGRENAHQVDARAIEPYLAGLATLRQPGDLSRLDGAEASFKQAISVDPEFAGAYAGLCRTHTRRFEPDPRPGFAGGCGAGVPAGARAGSLAGRDRESTCQHRALGRQVRAGRQSVCGHAPAQRRRCRRLHRVGRRAGRPGQAVEAEANYRRAVRAEPAYWGAHAALAKHLFEHGKVDEAVAAQRKVTELVPSSATAWSSLGGILQMKGDFDGALEAYQRSLQLEPSKDAYSNLATTYYYSNRFPEAVANYERAASLGEHDYVIQGNLADALWQVEERRDEAVARYRRAILLAETELQATPSDAGAAGATGVLLSPDRRIRALATLPGGSAGDRPGHRLRALFRGRGGRRPRATRRRAARGGRARENGVSAHPVAFRA